MDIYLAQMAIVRGKPELNRAKVTALTSNLAGLASPMTPAQSKAAQPFLLVLPELFSTGYLDESSPRPETLAAADRAFLSALAIRLGCWVAGSTVEAGSAGIRRQRRLPEPEPGIRTGRRRSRLLPQNASLQLRRRGSVLRQRQRNRYRGYRWVGGPADHLL